LSEATAKYDEQATPIASWYHTHTLSQVFRFASSKNASLFLQRKNPRKIAWTIVYRKMHKKGITEEIAKKRSRKTVKHQRGIVGADLATIAARRNQTAAVRTQQRLAAITKAKSEKKDKETKKAKVRVSFSFYWI
jgi:large subunit ribosomal protein L24e